MRAWLILFIDYFKTFSLNERHSAILLARNDSSGRSVRLHVGTDRSGVTTLVEVHKVFISATIDQYIGTVMKEHRSVAL